MTISHTTSLPPSPTTPRPTSILFFFQRKFRFSSKLLCCYRANIQTKTSVYLTDNLKQTTACTIILHLYIKPSSRLHHVLSSLREHQRKRQFDLKTCFHSRLWMVVLWVCLQQKYLLLYYWCGNLTIDIEIKTENLLEHCIVYISRVSVSPYCCERKVKKDLWESCVTWTHIFNIKPSFKAQFFNDLHVNNE